MGIESLESRLLLAGNVTVAVEAGELVITGDSDDNQISISESGGIFDVVGESGTTVTGGNNVAGVTAAIRIAMNSGEDRVSITRVSFGGDIDVNGGKDANELTISASTIDGNLRLENGAAKKSGDSSSTIVAQATLVETSSISGNVTIVHGKTTAFNKDSYAVGSQITVRDNVSIGGSISIDVQTTRATAKQSRATGADTSIRNNSIAGGINVAHNNSKALGLWGAFASDIEISDNATVSGNISLTHENSSATIKSPNGGNARASRTSLDGNVNLQGDIQISAGNAKVAGTAFSSSGNTVAVFDNNIGGRLEVDTLKANGRSSHENSNITGNGVYLGQNMIGDEVVITNGTGIVSGASASGNWVSINRSELSGGLRVTNASAKSTGNNSGFAVGNRIELAGYGSTVLAGNIQLANGNAQAKFGSTDNGGATANVISIGAAGATITVNGNVSMQNGTAKATSAGGTGSTGNVGVLGPTASITGDFTVGNGNAKVVATGNGPATGNVASLESSAMIGGMLKFTNANGSATASINSASGNVANVRGNSSASGIAEITHGNGKAIAKSTFGDASGNTTRIDSGVMLGDTLTIVHSSGSAVAKDGQSFGNETLANGSSVITFSGAVSVNHGQSKATGTSSVGSSSFFNMANMLSTFEYTADAGNNRLAIGDSTIVGTVNVQMGKGDDLLFLLDTVFTSSVSFDGGDGFDTSQDGGGNDFMAGLPNLTDVETIV